MQVQSSERRLCKHHSGLVELAFWIKGRDRVSKNGKHSSLDQKGITIEPEKCLPISEKICTDMRYVGMHYEREFAQQIWLVDGTLVTQRGGKDTIGEEQDEYAAYPTFTIVGETPDNIKRTAEYLGLPYDSAQLDRYCPLRP